jgi:hypothetical protein
MHICRYGFSEQAGNDVNLVFFFCGPDAVHVSAPHHA